MAEREFIQAKDLPMTEEEDVSLLVVDANGEMKRKTSTPPGWSFDIVVMLYPNSGDGYKGVRKAVLLHGDYSKISEKINSKLPIMPLIYKDFVESEDLMYSDAFNACGIRSMMNDDWQICYNTHFSGDVPNDAIAFCCGSLGYYVYLLPDNTIQYYIYD